MTSNNGFVKTVRRKPKRTDAKRKQTLRDKREGKRGNYHEKESFPH